MPILKMYSKISNTKAESLQYIYFYIITIPRNKNNTNTQIRNGVTLNPPLYSYKNGDAEFSAIKYQKKNIFNCQFARYATMSGSHD